MGALKKPRFGDWVRFRSWIDGEKRWARVVRISPEVVVEWCDLGDGAGPWRTSVCLDSGELLEIDNEPTRVDAGPRTM